VQRRLLSRCLGVDVKMLVHDKQDFCTDWANLEKMILNKGLAGISPFCSKIGQGLKSLCAPKARTGFEQRTNIGTVLAAQRERVKLHEFGAGNETMKGG